MFKKLLIEDCPRPPSGPALTSFMLTVGWILVCLVSITAVLLLHKWVNMSLL